MQQPKNEPIVMPNGHLRFVPHGKIDIESYENCTHLEVLKLGQCDTNQVIWPKKKMPHLHTLELMPTGGFENGNEILENLVLFPNVKLVMLQIHGFRGSITVAHLRNRASSIEQLYINGEDISVFFSLQANRFLKSLIYENKTFPAQIRK